MLTQYIAKDLGPSGITANTVASHLKSIYGKLNVSHRAQATLEALRLGLVKP